MSEPNDKIEVKERPKKPLGYTKFRQLLKQVIRAQPLKKKKGGDG